MNVTSKILEHTFVYRAWQAPFAEQKFAPIRKKNDLSGIRRVLDVACGPGTNSRHFTHVDYLGIDINENYIRDARQKYGRDFMAVDARKLDDASRERFDFILVNSFLHHLNDKDVMDVLSSLESRLSPDGHIHILELVLPENRSVARFLAHWDRGKFARPLQEWQTLFSQIFKPALFEPYSITATGAILWNMVYFKGRARR